MGIINNIVIALDPSGNFYEGKGTTGWSVFNALDNKFIHTGMICAKQYKTAEDYWKAHISLIDKYNEQYKGKIIVVIEEYFLYAHKMESQINSKMETSKLIGIIQYHLNLKNIKYKMQSAGMVKKRWDNKILWHKKIIDFKGHTCYLYGTPVKINKHIIDSIRHAIHFATFYNQEEVKK